MHESLRHDMHVDAWQTIVYSRLHVFYCCIRGYLSDVFFYRELACAHVAITHKYVRRYRSIFCSYKIRIDVYCRSSPYIASAIKNEGYDDHLLTT